MPTSDFMAFWCQCHCARPWAESWTTETNRKGNKTRVQKRKPILSTVHFLQRYFSRQNCFCKRRETAPLLCVITSFLIAATHISFITCFLLLSRWPHFFFFYSSAKQFSPVGQIERSSFFLARWLVLVSSFLSFSEVMVESSSMVLVAYRSGKMEWNIFFLPWSETQFSFQDL